MINPSSQCLLFDEEKNEPFIPLTSPHQAIRLTPIRTTDVDAVVRILNDPAVSSHLLTPYPFTTEHAGGWIGEQLRRYEPDRYFFPQDDARLNEKKWDYNPMPVIREVLSDGTNRFLGVAGIWLSPFLYEADAERKEELKRENEAKDAGDPSIIYSVAYYIEPAYHGRGIMTAAIRALFRPWAIPHMRVRIIRVGIIQDNIPSLRVLEKVGFHLAGKVDGVTPTQGKRGAVLGQWLFEYVVS